MEPDYYPPARIGKKKDMYMFLALHMEKSPACNNAPEKFNKTGIVVCEADKIHRVMAMGCSTQNLHAVQQIVLNVPRSLSNCTVYLSRKPCSMCATFLIQGSVASVYYWPFSPEIKGEKKEVEEDLKQVDQMFLRSHISSSVFLPDVDSDMVKSKISRRIRRQQCPKCKLTYTDTVPEDMEDICSLLNMKGHANACKVQMYHALRSLDYLLHCSHGKFEIKDTDVEERHTHALQLCYLLAARSDDPNQGVGCILYSQNGYFFGVGYNGYPIGAKYGNLPRRGRINKNKQGTAKKPFLVHAEVNALLFRSKKKIEENDVLYCSKPPCLECQNYIECVGIKNIVSVHESSKPTSNQESILESLKKKFTYNQWEPLHMESEASVSSKPQEDSEEKHGEDFKRESDKGPPDRLQEKEDLCIFLALHMENSPNCKILGGNDGDSQPNTGGNDGDNQPNTGGNDGDNQPNTAIFCKTGIVICEAEKPKRIITMDCSTTELHAVPKALLRLPNAVRGCEVYLSRMPCLSCAKFLVQAQVSKVSYWPNLEMQITETSMNQLEVETKQVDGIFRESYITAEIYIPILDYKTVDKKIFPKTGSPDYHMTLAPINSIFDQKASRKLLEILNLQHVKKENQFTKSYKEQIKNAQKCFQKLASGIDNQITEKNVEKSVHIITHKNSEYIHPLQLCYLLAARNDSYNTGVGTLIYHKDIIVAVGYNGYPKGTVNSLFAKKDDGSFDERGVICAEANAIILRTEEDLNGAVLITTVEPCSDCMKLIEQMKIQKVIWPDRVRNDQAKEATEDPANSGVPQLMKPRGVVDLTKWFEMDEERNKIKDTEETSVLGEEGEKKAIVAEEELSSGKATVTSSEASALQGDDSDVTKDVSEETKPLVS
ncbi:cytidine and dCMP deaminase domain-containing protein 1-like [Alligator sinensis]|uniref:Cytidine and dCMP deaminase domain-containing protein 1 n=1 Tax=Alligator sinensis TaxID=38654 RepID=A0A1U8D0T2_ALLSI|nr:cytidine and dCMP deaminase domain-containing protein 1-like [Alligator sinensis]